MPYKLSQSETAMLHYLAEFRTASPSEIESAFGHSAGYASTMAKTLEAKGLIETVRVGNKSLYAPTSVGEKLAAKTAALPDYRYTPKWKLLAWVDNDDD